MTISPVEIQHLPASYSIGPIRIAPNMLLAPMAGVTDSVFRRVILGLGGCGLVCTEMTNAASVTPKALRRHHLLDFYPQERPLSMQLSGNEPDLMAAAALSVERLGADIIDINCGCPSPKVTGGGHGSALLKDLPKLGQVLRAVTAAVSIPVTLKFRAGWDEARLNYLETARIAEDAGIAGLTLHPRTREQEYKGQADWSRVAEVKRSVSIPVVGSGDVKSAEEALARLRDSGADGVMIGRGAMENPWIFLQVAQLRRGEPIFVPSPDDKLAFLNQYLNLCLSEMPERLALNKLKQLVGQFVVGLPGSAVMRRGIHRSNTVDAARSEMERFFDPYLTAVVQ